MSYLVYINGQLIESQNLSFAQTKQINDIANLTTRNSNYTQSIKIRRTANNVRIFEGIYNVGNNSNIPYEKMECDVIDSETGQHIIYKGWFILLETTKDFYNGTVYDGVYDFYKRIENITITEIGVSELNHVKNIENIAETWTDETLPYRYILADYNGNNLAGINTNIDFQVPSASVQYLWNKIFDFIGWTYEGEIFQHEHFQNLWLSYPKPVSFETPLKILVTEQENIFVTTTVEWPVGGGLFYGSVTSASFLPSSSGYNNTYYSLSNGVQTAGLFRVEFSPILFTLSGTPEFTTSRVRIVISNNINVLLAEYYVSAPDGNYIDILLEAGNKISLTLVFEDNSIPFNGSSTPNSQRILSGELVTTNITFIEGFSLGFDQAFIDYKVSDFVKEIMIRFGLTAFKDKYSNVVTFKTLEELLQGTDINNLSSKFNNKLGEKYTFGNYAQRSTFNYKYNDDEAKHNNGFLSIDNKNLAEEISLFSSNIYSPERIQSLFLGGSNVYKIWDKEIKDDESVEYKDLDGRFYFLRADKITEPITLGSNILGGTQTTPFYFRESYHRLAFSEILFDWYSAINAIFNKAKMLTVEMNFKPVDIFNFDFGKLAYIEQLGSFYIVNKINNFIKGKPTKVELIEVDYFIEPDIINPTNPDYQVVLGEPILTACSLTIPITTDYPTQPVNVVVNVYQGVFGIAGFSFVQVNLDELITSTLSGGEVTFPIDALPFNLFGYQFSITILDQNPFLEINSPLSQTVFLDGSCYTVPAYPTTLVLNSSVYIGTFANYPYFDNYRYNLLYSYTGITAGQSYVLYIEYYAAPISTPTSPAWQLLSYNKIAGSAGEFSMVVNIPTLYTQPTKMRLKIQLITSNEIVL